MRKYWTNKRYRGTLLTSAAISGVGSVLIIEAVEALSITGGWPKLALRACSLMFFMSAMAIWTTCALSRSEEDVRK